MSRSPILNNPYFWFENPERHTVKKLFFAQREAIETGKNNSEQPPRIPPIVKSALEQFDNPEWFFIEISKDIQDIKNQLSDKIGGMINE